MRIIRKIKRTKKKDEAKLRRTFSFGRLALVVCNRWRRFRVLISLVIISSHHSIHFSSLNFSYTSSSSDISPSSFTKGSTLWGFRGLSLFIWTWSLEEPAFPFLTPLRDTETVTGFSLSLEALRPTLAFAFFPPRAASSWLHTFHSSTHTNNDPKNLLTLYTVNELENYLHAERTHTDAQENEQITRIKALGCTSLMHDGLMQN